MAKLTAAKTAAIKSLVNRAKASGLIAPAPTAPGNPVREVGPAQAAQLLGIARSTLCPLLDQRTASRIIKWRWLNPDAKGKRVFDLASLHAYRKVTQQMAD